MLTLEGYDNAVMVLKLSGRTIRRVSALLVASLIREDETIDVAVIVTPRIDGELRNRAVYVDVVAWVRIPAASARIDRECLAIRSLVNNGESIEIPSPGASNPTRPDACCYILSHDIFVEAKGTASITAGDLGTDEIELY